MKQTRLMMGMPITLEVVDPKASAAHLDRVFDYFQYVDRKFSTYKDDSEISAINRREITVAQSSSDMRAVFWLAEQTRHETDGYFDIERAGRYDPSGLVKGWAIYHAAEILWGDGFENFYVEAGGDIQAAGKNCRGEDWRVGIRNPFNPAEIVKVLRISNGGVATSGTYVRGQHIYDPQDPGALETEIVSLTVIGPDIFDADRFATAAFAMGAQGIQFIEGLEEFEGYMIDRCGQATLTSGLGSYVAHD
jgi:thiamine biosynthesis lipoprotein